MCCPATRRCPPWGVGVDPPEMWFATDPSCLQTSAIACVGLTHESMLHCRGHRQCLMTGTAARNMLGQVRYDPRCEIGCNRLFYDLSMYAILWSSDRRDQCHCPCGLLCTLETIHWHLLLFPVEACKYTFCTMTLTLLTNSVNLQYGLVGPWNSLRILPKVMASPAVC